MKLIMTFLSIVALQSFAQTVKEETIPGSELIPEFQKLKMQYEQATESVKISDFDSNLQKKSNHECKIVSEHINWTSLWPENKYTNKTYMYNSSLVTIKRFSREANEQLKEDKLFNLTLNSSYIPGTHSPVDELAEIYNQTTVVSSDEELIITRNLSGTEYDSITETRMKKEGNLILLRFIQYARIFGRDLFVEEEGFGYCRREF